MVGNVPDLNAAGFRATQDTLNYLLIKGLDAEQMQYTLDCRTQLLKGFSVSNLRMQEDLLILYNDYQLLNRSQQNIAHKRTVVAKNETNNIKVDIDMNRIQIDEPMNIEFEIPIGYKRTLP